MTTCHLAHTEQGSIRADDLASLWLIDLLEHIVAGGEPQRALNELHQNRRVFRRRGGKPLRLVEFLDELCAGPLPEEFGITADAQREAVYDAVLSRFLSLPIGGEDERSRAVDSRHYFGATLRAAQHWRDRHPRADLLTLESEVAQLLQGQVVRQIAYCCLNVLRGRNGAASRYDWPVRGGVIRVRLPVWLYRGERPAWLARHVSDPDPDRPGESKRVQQIIDSHFGPLRVVSLEQPSRSNGVYEGWARYEANPLDQLVAEEVSRQGLPEALAAEKARDIRRQRRRIRELGRAKLKAMIHAVLEARVQGEACDHEIAAAFGLTRSTFSRFAGSHWQLNEDDARRADNGRERATETNSAVPHQQRVPDLWRNLAQVLSRHPVFREVAQEAGVWPGVSRIASQPQGAPT
ncbi:MAG: hypothetical protein AAGH88_09090 [Planctomycetota bacterium]